MLVDMLEMVLSMKTIFNRSARCFLDYVGWHAKERMVLMKGHAHCLDYVDRDTKEDGLDEEA